MPTSVVVAGPEGDVVRRVQSAFMRPYFRVYTNADLIGVEIGVALKNSIAIPHFCYHEALGADGNCRMCMVEIKGSKRPQIACDTFVREGMEVSTTSDSIVQVKRNILELELINHPVDCPVCDQAGECKLQDYYMTYDHVESRMDVPQVTKGKKMDFGAGVIHDQERCVLCGRCVRFCRQITKTGELGIINRTDAARVNIFPGRPLANRYALNVVDLCPVGAMTSKDFRFKQRVWFLKKAPGICHGCSKGCNITIDHNREKYKDDLIYRFRPRFNEQVNGYFMCDEGRLSYKKENEGRLTEAKISTKVRSLDNVLDACTKTIEQAEKIVMAVSPNCSLEQMVTVKALAEKLGATLSGFSEGYIKAGDGDKYLIQDDKSANRAGLTLLGIDCSKAGFEKAVVEATLLINFNNDLTLSYQENELAKLLKNTKVVTLGTTDNQCAALADMVIPVASFSEYAGSIINCDNILQRFPKAITKNEDLADISAIAVRLGSPLRNDDERYAVLQQYISALKEFSYDQIPAEGLNLKKSEAANVTA